VLVGGAGDDALFGDAGTDVLAGGPGVGDDSLSGGDGSDTLLTLDGSAADTVSGGAGTNHCVVDAKDVTHGC
jgi:Ca2+-binding RTX toxin-like protein